MKFSYQFSNLLGSVYRKGNILFSPDGSRVVSPVGNRVSIFDLKSNKSQTLPIETTRNITEVALSPDGYTAILVTEEGEAFLVSLISYGIFGNYHFHGKVNQIKFSPDGRKFAVATNTVVIVFHAPGKNREFNPFDIYQTYTGHVDETTSIDWSSDSRVICTGSRDRRTRVVAVQRLKNLKAYDLGAQREAIVGSFFEHNSLDIYSLAQDGFLTHWECDTYLADLEAWDAKLAAGMRPEKDDDEETKQKRLKIKDDLWETRLQYKPLHKFSYGPCRKSSTHADMTAAAFHKPTHLLVVGYSDGTFFLHEMPDFNLIHSLSISDQSIDSICINNTGDWIGLACGRMGQLLVWEWQSESYVLKQQGHFDAMTCVTYSPDGQNIITGGGDGKVKVWNSMSGFCFVTFSEHTGEITGIKVTQNGKSVLSSSLDGTVRAFDLTRYRNYKTFTSPRPDQFSCLAVDSAGEIVCAGGMDEFQIYVWTLKTGRLLQTLPGHQGPISSIDFSPRDGYLVSGSWDKTVRVWNVYEGGTREALDFVTDVLAVVFRPDGKEFAAATLNCQITFWDLEDTAQTGSIEGRHDLGYFRKETDKIAAKTSAEGKAFETLCYSADGQCIIAAGRSKHVCIYSVKDQLLMKKFTISCNLSFDGMEEFLDRRKMTEWGSMALVDSGQGDDKTAIALPGVKKGDHSSRFWKPEVRVYSLQFSPTGRSWVACTTEGLLVYSLDHSLLFDPYDLDIDITPARVKTVLQEGDYANALMLSFRLNEQSLIQEVIESIGVDNAASIAENLPDVYVDKLLAFTANMVEHSAHIEFYLQWICPLLTLHGPKLKQRSQKVMTSLRTLQRNMTRKYDDLRKIADHNKYTSQYLLSLSKLKRKKALKDEEEDDDDNVRDSDEEDEEEEEEDDDDGVKALSYTNVGDSSSDDNMDFL